jgi:catechol 2,3-dioxygenase
VTTPQDPEELDAAAAAVVTEIPAGTTLGPVHLTVGDLERSLAWYEHVLGLRVRDRAPGRGDGEADDRDGESGPGSARAARPGHGEADDRDGESGAGSARAARPGRGDGEADDRDGESGAGSARAARSHRRASLGTDTELLVLVEEPGARPARGCTGLYHFALLLPERRDLARWLAHVAREHVPLSGLSDHFVSEAIYLDDPDQHGIEIYWDRPRETWEGRVDRMGTWPLDVQSLLGELDEPATEPFEGLPGPTIMGHVHLKVSEVASTIDFYRDRLGFGLMAQLGAQAAFLSAGGYHHHVGANTWESAGAPPPPPGSAALRHATVVLPGEQELDELLGRLGGDEPLVRDPSGNTLLLTA